METNGKENGKQLSANIHKHSRTDLVFGPGVGIGEQPGGGDGRALLGANLQRADHWDAVIITCRRKETSYEELKLS